MATEAIAIEPGESVRSAPGEEALWCAALALLIEDAKGHVTGRRAWSTPLEVAQAAFEDVVSMGPMLRWCCDHTGHDPQWISEAFRREWCVGTGYGKGRIALAGCEG